MIRIIPIRTVSEGNVRECWPARHRRRSKQRGTVKLVIGAEIRRHGITPPCAVHLTRIAPSNGLDDDNLVGSQKSVRDGVADALGIDDRNPSVTWHYAQRRGAWAVEIRIEAAS